MRAVRSLVPPLLALLLAASACLGTAAPASAARGTEKRVVLEHAPAKAKTKRPLVKAKRGSAKTKRATASAKTKRTAASAKAKPGPKTNSAKRLKKPRKRASRPTVQLSVPRPATPPSLFPNDPLWRDSWSLTKTNAAGAWSLTTGASDTVVAVLDTGVDLAHPDLQGAFVSGYDTVNEDSDASDDHGHGTMVAGIVAARSNNGIGVVGTCWRCSLMPVKVIAGNGIGSAVDVAEGIIWAADHGARVINMSFTMSAPDGAVAAAVEHARAKGVILVAAAGNNGGADQSFPAAFPGVVSVAGTDAADARYEWSSFGSWVRLAAPGCNQTTAPGGSYGEFCGTSSATAFVSGLAGLARSLAPSVSADAIGDAFAAHAVPVGDFVSAGRVDATAALGAVKSLKP